MVSALFERLTEGDASVSWSCNAIIQGLIP